MTALLLDRAVPSTAESPTDPSLVEDRSATLASACTGSGNGSASVLAAGRCECEAYARPLRLPPIDLHRYPMPAGLASAAMDRPSASRIDNVMLDTAYNFGADRRAAAAVADAGWLRALVWAQREFLGRAVRHLVNEGVNQFVDLGCGVPVLGATTRSPTAPDPEARVVYVDNDEVAVAVIRDLVRARPHVAVVHADARDVSAVLDHPEVTGLLDLTLPVGVVAVGLLHFMDNAAEVMAGLVSRLPRGSLVVVSHAVADDDLYRPVSALAALDAATPTPLVPRVHDEVSQMLAGFDLVGEGLVPPHRWQPARADAVEPRPCDGIPLLAAVGRHR